MKLPLHPKDSWEIIDEDGKYICLAVNTPDRDYIIKVVNSHVQAINSHEKFKIALENIVSLETECCPRCEGSGRLWADGKAHHQHEQVDTISCGNCGGSGRILPEDAQVIASKALKEVGENQ